MTKPIYAIYGASGCGRSLMPVARQQLQRDGLTAELYFIDDRFDQPTVWNGHPAVNYAAFQQLQASSKHVVIAIANSRIREKIALQLQQDQIKMWSIYADNVVLMDEVELGEGSALSPFVTVTSNIRIGKCFHANLYSYVEHDCLIGDYVTFAPGVKCNGNIHIHDHAYIGAGAIGQGAVIGMGAVVTKSVPAGVTVVGNPARIMQKK